MARRDVLFLSVLLILITVSSISSAVSSLNLIISTRFYIFLSSYLSLELLVFGLVENIIFLKITKHLYSFLDFSGRWTRLCLHILRHRMSSPLWGITARCRLGRVSVGSGVRSGSLSLGLYEAMNQWMMCVLETCSMCERVMLIKKNDWSNKIQFFGSVWLSWIKKKKKKMIILN